MHFEIALATWTSTRSHGMGAHLRLVEVLAAVHPGDMLLGRARGGNARVARAGAGVVGAVLQAELGTRRGEVGGVPEGPVAQVGPVAELGACPKNTGLRRVSTALAEMAGYSAWGLLVWGSSPVCGVIRSVELVVSASGF